MGPHVFACGNISCSSASGGTAGLQWGRTFLRAEIAGVIAQLADGEVLQWGRTFLRAEMVTSGKRCGPIGLLQWGRTFLRAEISYTEAAVAVWLAASMGPHVFACGNTNTATIKIPIKGLQWGRTFLRAEIL